jgi:hypothetical protein
MLRIRRASRQAKAKRGRGNPAKNTVSHATSHIEPLVLPQLVPVYCCSKQC